MKEIFSVKDVVMIIISCFVVVVLALSTTVGVFAESPINVPKSYTFEMLDLYYRSISYGGVDYSHVAGKIDSGSLLSSYPRYITPFVEYMGEIYLCDYSIAFLPVETVYAQSEQRIGYVSFETFSANSAPSSSADFNLGLDWLGASNYFFVGSFYNSSDELVFCLTHDNSVLLGDSVTDNNNLSALMSKVARFENLESSDYLTVSPIVDGAVPSESCVGSIFDLGLSVQYLDCGTVTPFTFVQSRDVAVTDPGNVVELMYAEIVSPESADFYNMGNNAYYLESTSSAYLGVDLPAEDLATINEGLNGAFLYSDSEPEIVVSFYTGDCYNIPLGFQIYQITPYNVAWGDDSGTGFSFMSCGYYIPETLRNGIQSHTEYIVKFKVTDFCSIYEGSYYVVVPRSRYLDKTETFIFECSETVAGTGAGSVNISIGGDDFYIDDSISDVVDPANPELVYGDVGLDGYIDSISGYISTAERFFSMCYSIIPPEMMSIFVVSFGLLITIGIIKAALSLF